MVVPHHNSRQSVAVPALANGKRQGAVASKRIPGMASHGEHERQLSEYALEQLQLFFSKRPSAALVKFFTANDDDFDGSLDFPEFQSAIARFMELPEAASHALFDAIPLGLNGATANASSAASVDSAAGAPEVEERGAAGAQTPSSTGTPAAAADAAATDVVATMRIGVCVASPLAPRRIPPADDDVIDIVVVVAVVKHRDVETEGGGVNAVMPPTLLPWCPWWPRL